MKYWKQNVNSKDRGVLTRCEIDGKAFAMHIWFPIIYLVIKVLVIMNPINFGSFRRSPNVKIGPLSFTSHLVVTMNPIHSGTVLRSYWRSLEYSAQECPPFCPSVCSCVRPFISLTHHMRAKSQVTNLTYC